MVKAMKKAGRPKGATNKSMKKAGRPKGATNTPMGKGALLKLLAEKNELKLKQVCGIIDGLAEVAAKEVKRVNKFTIPHLCMIKSRVKPATKAGKRMMFGKEIVVKAQPAKTVVKGYLVA